MPYDPEQVARQRSEQRSMERESAGRAKGATGSPLKSTGGGGFQPSGKAIKAAPDPTFDKTTSGPIVVPPGTKPRTTKTSFGPGDV